MYVMPRKPTFDHPIRRLRETIGLTQPQFASLVGVGKDALQSIENGRRPLSRHLAFKIRRQTGCVLRRTVDQRGREVFEVRNLCSDTLRTYQKKDYEAYRSKPGGLPDEDVEHTIHAASRCVALLLQAASRRGTSGMS